MMRIQFAALTAMSLLVGAPARAQPQPATSAPSIGTATVSPTGVPPSRRNPLLTDSGNVRIGKMLGTTIYNKDDKELGSVDDVIASRNGRLQVIVSPSSKLIALPWGKVQFGDAKLNSDNKVLVPDVSLQDLSKMPAFSYRKD
jgi:PRC-barrel domain